MIKLFLLACSLVLVLEGVLPFISPGRYRDWMGRLGQQTDHSLRAMGLICMLIGACCIVIIHWFF